MPLPARAQVAALGVLVAAPVLAVPHGDLRTLAVVPRQLGRCRASLPGTHPLLIGDPLVKAPAPRLRFLRSLIPVPASTSQLRVAAHSQITFRSNASNGSKFSSPRSALQPCTENSSSGK